MRRFPALGDDIVASPESYSSVVYMQKLQASSTEAVVVSCGVVAESTVVESLPRLEGDLTSAVPASSAAAAAPAAVGLARCNMHLSTSGTNSPI